MKPEPFKEKNEFIATLELALLRDNRSGVEDIPHIYKPEYDDEYIDVHFRGGGGLSGFLQPETVTARQRQRDHQGGIRGIGGRHEYIRRESAGTAAA